MTTFPQNLGAKKGTRGPPPCLREPKWNLKIVFEKRETSLGSMNGQDSHSARLFVQDQKYKMHQEILQIRVWKGEYDSQTFMYPPSNTVPGW